MRQSIVYGDRMIAADLPDDTTVVSPGLSLPLPPAPDIEQAVKLALDEPLDREPLHTLVRAGSKVTIAFDDPTVPCYAPVWGDGLADDRFGDRTRRCQSRRHVPYLRQRVAPEVHAR